MIWKRTKQFCLAFFFFYPSSFPLFVFRHEHRKRVQRVFVSSKSEKDPKWFPLSCFITTKNKTTKNNIFIFRLFLFLL